MYHIICLVLVLVSVPWVLGAEETAQNDKGDIAAAIAADTKDNEINNVTQELPVKTGIQAELPDIAIIADMGAAVFTKPQHIRQGGHGIDENGFTLQSVELTIGGSVDPYFRYDFSFQFMGLHIEEAYVSTLSLPWNLQVKAGYMFAQAGKENTRCLHSLDFVNYSLMHSRFMSSEHFSGLGVDLSYLFPIPWYMLIRGQMFDTKKATGLRSSSFADNSYTSAGEITGLQDFVYVTRMENYWDLSENIGLSLGFNADFGQSQYVPNDRVMLYGVDLYLKWRDIAGADDALSVVWWTEFFMRDTQVPESYVTDYAGFTQVVIGFNRFWQLGVRGDYGAILHGESVNPETMAPWEYRGSLSVSFMPTHFSRLRFEYEVGNRAGLTTAVPYQGFFLQLEAVLGSHQAHQY